MGQAINILEQEEKYVKAGSNQLRLIGQIIPYLEYRYEAGIKWRQCPAGEAKENYEKMIEHCNENIKLILGL